MWLESIAIVTPNFRDSHRGVNIILRDPRACEIDFEDDVGSRIVKQIDRSPAAHSARELDVVARVGLGAADAPKAPSEAGCRVESARP